MENKKIKRKSQQSIVNKEAKLSKLLFNNTEDLVEKLKNTNNNELEENSQKPAWIDEDDKKFSTNIPNVKSKGLYSEKLKNKYETLMGNPSWAKINKKGETDYDGNDKIVATVGHLLKEKETGLGKNKISLKVMPKINYSTCTEGPIISCIEFHPKSSVALVAGQAGVVSLFSVGGRQSDKLHSFKINKWGPITSALFSLDGNQAYIASNKSKYYYVYDLIKAETKLIHFPNNLNMSTNFKLSPDEKYIATTDGHDEVFLMCAKSKELLRCLKHNTNVASIVFSFDSKELYSYGLEGEITIWDLSTYRVTKKFYDNGCVKGSCITTSPCGTLLATGSNEGIVNIYQTSNITTSDPLPLKTISNLTTKITTLKFNPTTEILAAASGLYPNAVKLIHIPAYQVFMNFPQQDFNFHHVNSLSFSPSSGYMALGNNKGSAYLYRLSYYKNY